MSFVRRDLLQSIEAKVQEKWEKEKVFEQDAPDDKQEKFMCTFPYPYMNGKLHIGHAFSLTKAVFAAHFQRLCGKRVLFPFGFHCSGMPIQAAANKLKREYETYGSPYPIFPSGRPSPKESAEGVICIDDEGVTLTWKAPCCTGKKAIKAFHVLRRVGLDGDFAEVSVIKAPSEAELKEKKNKMEAKIPIESGRSCFYKISTELADGTTCPESKESDGVSVDAAPKAKGTGKGTGPRVAKKVLAKGGDAAFQFEILLSMGLDIDDMPAFADPMHWLHYFPPLGRDDLKRFGTPVDFRRSFITTSVNPYYDSFVRWQFAKLKAGEKIGFGKRPTIFSELDGQACMDHDRAEGEGVAPCEYTAIKLQLLETPPALKSLEGRKIFVLAATLRPETMPGQTNCWILPGGEYGCFKASEKEVYICSHRAARNMAFQDILLPWGRPECLLNVTGKDLMGCRVHAPTSKYEGGVHMLPLSTIKMDKGTGIVTSVPSDSPDDYACFMDLKKPGKHEFYGIKPEWINPFECIPIIDCEIDGEVRTEAAKYMCEKLGVQSQNDKVKLQEAHDVVYLLGFERGIMTTGPFKGEPVKKAKVEMKALMCQNGQAFTYREPEKKVISRTGDECVVAGVDQWYLKYGDDAWKQQIIDHMQSPNFETYNSRIKDSFLDAADWLKEWACSRSFGLGTRVPWDEKFLIESLSDSTIYMAYYTVAHILQGDLEGTQAGSGKIAAEDMTNEVWDYVFLNAPEPKGSKIKKETLQKMRQEFRFWYPLDLRVSGKDLIQNHLTMCLYNHAAVWHDEPEMWPRSMFTNGWLLVNNEKMSKSKGNFFTLEDIMAKFSADTVRMAMANSGDTLEAANFEEKVAEKALLAFPVFLEGMESFLKGSQPTQEGPDDARFVDRWFANEMARLVVAARKEYEDMRYREALKFSYFEFTGAFDKYQDVCKAAKLRMHKSLVQRYYEWQMIILSPICPHLCEHGWGLLGKKGTVMDAEYPVPPSPSDTAVTTMGAYIYDKVPHDFIKIIEKTAKQGKPVSGTVYIAKVFPDWKVHVLQMLREKHAAGKLPLVVPDDMKSDDVAKEQWKGVMADLMGDASLKPVMKHVGPFAAFKRDEAARDGASALEATVAFDELALVQENLAFLGEKCKVNLTVAYAEDLKSPDHKVAADNAQPGTPAVHFVLDGSGSVAKGKPAAKGAAAPAKGAAAPAKGASGGVAPKAAPGAAPKIFTSLKDLDAHLSTRSFMESDAPRPSQHDAVQFAAMPAGDLEGYPHANRWHKLIRSFTATQRSKWGA